MHVERSRECVASSNELNACCCTDNGTALVKDLAPKEGKKKRRKEGKILFPLLPPSTGAAIGAVILPGDATRIRADPALRGYPSVFCRHSAIGMSVAGVTTIEQLPFTHNAKPYEDKAAACVFPMAGNARAQSVTSNNCHTAFIHVQGVQLPC